MSITEVPVDVFPVTPEHARQLVEATLSAVQHSHILRVPKTEQQRQNSFAAWIAECRCQFEPLIYTALGETWPELYASVPEQRLAAVAEQHI